MLMDKPQTPDGCVSIAHAALKHCEQIHPVQLGLLRRAWHAGRDARQAPLVQQRFVDRSGD
jgi:hypothetical protein